MKKIKIWFLRVVAQPSRARVNKQLRKDNLAGISSIMFSDGESGYLRNYK